MAYPVRFQEPNYHRNDGYTEDLDEDSDSLHNVTDQSDTDIEDIHPQMADNKQEKQLSNGNVPDEQLSNGNVPDKQLGGSRRKSSKKKEPWDVFEERSKDGGHMSNLQFWNNVNKITRVIFLTIFAVIVCMTAVISKLTLIYMLSNINVPIHHRNSTSLKTYNGTIIYPNQKTEVTWIWAILLCMMAPYIFTLLKSLNRLLFKKTNPLKPVALLVALIIETIHSIGLCILIFIVLPNLDPIISSIVILNVGTVPAILKIIFPSRNRLPSNEFEPKGNSYKICSSVTMNIAIALLHVGGLGLISFHILNPPRDFSNDSNSKKQRQDTVVLLIVSCICISVNWWENFVPKGRKYSKGLPTLKRYFMEGRSKIMFVTSMWKLVLTSCVFPVIYGYIMCGEECIDFVFFKYPKDQLVAAKNPLIMETILTDGTVLESCTTFKRWLPFLLALIYIFLNGACYKFGKAACKVVAQRVAFGLPLSLSTPISLALLLEFMSSQDISSKDNIGTFYFGECLVKFPYWDNDEENRILHLSESKIFSDIWPLVAGGILSYFSLLLITNFIWSPKKERLQPTDKLFVKPLYCGMLLEQSFMLNRRRTDDEYRTTIESNKHTTLPIPEWPEDPNWNPKDDWSILRKDDTPMIYMCATMWHETQNEMTQVLKSVCRMDEDQCARRNLMMFFGIQDPDYYEFEAHIFFDDAYEAHGQDEYDYTVNGFVKILVECIDTAASAVHNRIVKVPDPTKIPTPYGGQLIWKLPGGNKIIAHLKDKQKIRHKKRWSQVMYMYYFLGHKLMEIKKRRRAKQIIAENTFILALDGDVDFQPSAVQLLVDRMKKNLNVGAACGRIHPIGSGPMIWYQKFEYAVSHWLQKSAENMIGCVLCSPGCFSLFRGSSLMDDNVMRKYTSLPVEAYQYVQYDQGEDRWLCTLLLQQGYKVEYVAASDALTFAPEGFYEFYNQRRRWAPSTMANIMDLLMDWKSVTKKNDDISLLCVGYQMLLLASSMLTPGTILLMILGALYTAFPLIQPWTAFVVNLIPVVIMVTLCFVARKEVQLSFAAILSTVYALVMMIVIVGLLKEAVAAQFCSVTTFFLIFVASAFVIAALLHPQEIWCILHGLLYFLAIPSMSMLMMIYALGNLHDISWGTRDGGTPAPSANTQQSRSKLNDIRSWVMGPQTTATSTSEYQFSFGNLFRCMCCPQSGQQNEDTRLRAVLDRLDDMETRMTSMSQRSMDTFMEHNEPEVETPFSKQAYAFEGAGEERRNPLFAPEKQQPRNELQNPYWIQDADMKNGAVEYMPENEIQFWESFIEKYLKPLNVTPEHKKKIEQDLLQLRNKVCLAFLLLNALFVTIVYTLTEVNKQEFGSLSISLHCKTGEKVDKGYGQGHIEPISFAFTAVFGIMLLVQFICMLFHRYSTLLHVVASTEINLQKRVRDTIFRGDNKEEQKEIAVDEGLELVRQMQSNQNDTDSDTSSVYSFKTDTESEYGGDTLGPNKGKELWKKIAKRQKHMAKNTLSKNFMRNFSKLQKVVDADETASQTKNPETGEDKIHFVRQNFGPSRLTHKSLKTVVTMIQNEGIKEQIRRKSEHIQKLKGDKAKEKFKSAAFKITRGPQKSFASIVMDAKQQQKIKKIDSELEVMEHQTDLKQSVEELSGAEPEIVVEPGPSKSNQSETTSIAGEEDAANQITDESDSDSSSQSFSPSGQAVRGSFEVSAPLDSSHDLSNSDVLF